jgi:hypothetical protein
MYSDEAITALGEALLGRTLPKAEWTHAAHCAACIYLLTRRRDIDVAVELPGIIWRYNLASGTPNSDDDGYHETITRFYIAAIGAYLTAQPAGLSLSALVARFMASALGARDLPLKFWSKARLMSVEARRVWVAPDLAPLDFKPLIP